MKGVIFSFLVLLIVLILIVFLAFIGLRFFSTEKAVQTSMAFKIYSMDNALDAARIYSETGLRYSVYQACFDALKSVDFLSYSGSEFLDEVKSGAKQSLNKYAGPDYRFLGDYSVRFPAYQYIDIIPNSLPEKVVSRNYNVEVEFDFPQGIKPGYKEYSGNEIREIFNSVMAGRVQNIDEMALYRAFSERQSLLNEKQTTINSATVGLSYLIPEEGKKLISMAIINDALAKFKPSFIENHVRRIYVLEDLELKLILEDYISGGTQKFGETLDILRSFSTPEGDIFIDYQALVDEGSKAIYREIANIISFTEFDPQEWIAETGIRDILLGKYSVYPVFVKRIGLPDIRNYYVTEEAYISRRFTGKPITLANPASLNGPRQDFSEIAAILLAGGKELKALRSFAKQEEKAGLGILKRKIDKAEQITSRNAIIVKYIEKLQSVLDFYSRGLGFNLTEFARERLSIINSQREAPEEIYSKLSVIATSPHKLRTEQNDNKTKILIERNPEIEEDIVTDCYRIFLIGQEKFSELSSALSASIENEIKDLPAENATAQLPANSTENSCDSVFSSLTGKSMSAMKNEISENIRNSLEGVTVQVPDGFSSGTEFLENKLTIKPFLISNVQRPQGKEITCSFDYHASVSLRMNITDINPEQIFPVFDGTEVAFTQLELNFLVEADFSRIAEKPVAKETPITPSGQQPSGSPPAEGEINLNGVYDVAMSITSPQEAHISAVAELAQAGEQIEGTVRVVGNEEIIPVTGSLRGGSFIINDIEGLSFESKELVIGLSGTASDGGNMIEGDVSGKVSVFLIGDLDIKGIFDAVKRAGDAI